ncbi:hypothetical protein C8P63_103180 [Melghirimyces profundicolus]|uniref:Uncharacterized protein n=1 Tax=Melghirimyces profundicolus TaxID=1242148 RepID=A0A2T6C7V1_9BACL|nr:hypothetical protein [Melghirimyces profundicolus]PTX64394.1 hypothetical protein C8P63_103180 [Melghirimyces profundicolus]
MTEKQKERLKLLKALEAQIDSEQRITWSLMDPEHENESNLLRQNLKQAKEIVNHIFRYLQKEREQNQVQGMGKVDQVEKEHLIVQALWEQVRSMGLLLDMLGDNPELKDEEMELRWLTTHMRSCLRKAGKKLPDPVDEFLEEILQCKNKGIIK